jgi:hypothetical protein
MRLHQREPRAARRARQLVRVTRERPLEFLLPLRHGAGIAEAAAHRIDGGDQLGQRAPREHLVAVEWNARAAGADETLLHAFEQRVAFREPLGALAGFLCELATLLDVIGDLGAQLHRCGGRVRARIAFEVFGHGSRERIARGVDGMAVRRPPGLHVVGDRAVVADEFLLHGGGATRERFGILLHALHGLDGLARRPAGEGVADENDGGDGRQADREPAAYPQARAP